MFILIHYILVIGILKGLADGFYYYPKSILDSEKINNENRQKFSGIVNTINKIMAIGIPICLGFLLTFMNYTDLGKIFFMLFIVMFLVSFSIDDYKHLDKKFEMKKFLKLVKDNFKPEYYCIQDILFSTSRVTGYIVLLVMVLLCGINYINYILIICGLFLMIEALVLVI